MTEDAKSETGQGLYSNLKKRIRATPASSMTDSSQADGEPGGLSEKGRAFALMFFEHVEKQVALATTKASLLMAASALLITGYIKIVSDYRDFFVTAATANKGLLSAAGWANASSVQLAECAALALFVLGGALLLLGFILALWAIIPHVAVDEDNVSYFSWIATQTDEAYREQFLKEDSENRFDELLLRQISRKSAWLKRMFRKTASSLRSTIAGTLSCVLMVIVALVLFYGNGFGKETARLDLGGNWFVKTGEDPFTDKPWVELQTPPGKAEHWLRLRCEESSPWMLLGADLGADWQENEQTRVTLRLDNAPPWTATFAYVGSRMALASKLDAATYERALRAHTLAARIERNAHAGAFTLNLDGIDRAAEPLREACPTSAAYARPSEEKAIWIAPK